MKFFAIGLHKKSSTFILEQIFGSLLQVPNPQKKRIDNLQFPEKLKRNLTLCSQPYLLERQSPKAPYSMTGDSSYLHLTKRASRLVRLWRSNLFWLAHQYASFSKPVLQDSSEAIALFRKETKEFPQNTLCLPRSLFAASASQRFADTGVLFIGVFLPSRSMHAWILEDGRQPDADDQMWINFQPVAALC
jgi:hypothetical protein